MNTQIDLLGLSGKVFIVIGGGGVDNKGIGVSSCLLLSAAGAKVVVIDREEARANAVAEIIRSQGGDALALDVDATDSGQIDAMVNTTLRHYGAIDGLVTVFAGTKIGPALDYSEENWERDMVLNLKYAWLCAKAVGAVMIERKIQGSIVSISSIRPSTGSYYQLGYGIFKSGLESMVKTLAVEWGEHGIRVNAVAPGATTTPQLAAQLDTNPALMKKMKALVPMNRLATPDDIGRVVLFLSSDLAGYVTGQTVIADGGYLLNHALVMYRDTAWVA
jgi:NAD(P)-dependent dehydrogenase (short-subunit alcohol dehydrogenase family)